MLPKDDLWDYKYSLLCKYYHYYGNCDLRNDFITKDGINYNQEGIKLGRWLQNQKQFYKRGELKADRIKKLEQINVNWVIRDNWDEYYNLLKKYYEHYGNTRVPVDFCTKDGINYDSNGVNLYLFVRNQKAYHRNGTLSLERSNLLDALGIFKPYTYDWDFYYSLAKAYHDAYGNLKVRERFKTFDGVISDPNGYPLGNFLASYKYQYKHGLIAEDKKQLLEDLGIIWSREDEWYDNFLDSKAYYEKYHRMSTWLLRQTRVYNKLTPKKKELIDSLNITIYNNGTTWLNYYSLAENFYNPYHHLTIPVLFTTKDGYTPSMEGLDIGSWLTRQKNLYSKNELSLDKIALLEKLNIVWSIRINNKIVKQIMQKYNIPQEEYSTLKNIPDKILLAKINYLQQHQLPLIVEFGMLNKIFMISNADLKEEYQIDLEELVKEYGVDLDVSRRVLG